MGGEKGKKDVDATESTDTDAKQMINDAKPTIMPRIKARWREKMNQENSFITLIITSPSINSASTYIP